jgi:tRNA threonylcarbamoyladenosine biosynthesis protein TsaB
MLILSIDTCGPSPMSNIGDRGGHPEPGLSRLRDNQPKDLGTIALARLKDDEPEILSQTELPGKTYSAQLVPAIRGLLAHHSAAIADLTAIVVTSGPGSFTGIRIALSTAKGLAEAHSIPILAVSRLAVLAHKAQIQTSPGLNSQVQAAALDASRHEFYFGDYSAPSPRESLLTAAQLGENALSHHIAICEESALAVAPAATLVPPPTAADALRFALPRLRAHDYDDPVTLDGNYLRRSDAEIFAKLKLHPAHP